MSNGHERITDKDIGDRYREMFPPLYEPNLPYEIRLHGTSLVHCDLCPKDRDELCQIPCYTQQHRVVLD